MDNDLFYRPKTLKDSAGFVRQDVQQEFRQDFRTDTRQDSMGQTPPAFVNIEEKNRKVKEYTDSVFIIPGTGFEEITGVSPEHGNNINRGSTVNEFNIDGVSPGNQFNINGVSPGNDYNINGVSPGNQFNINGVSPEYGDREGETSVLSYNPDLYGRPRVNLEKPPFTPETYVPPKRLKDLF